MPFINVDGTRLYYRLEGREDRPTLVFSHSLGVDHGQWAMQTADLLPYFQVLRYDIRGHGASDAPAGDYSIEQLGRDALALADALGIRKFAFCGLSLGGMIGQWLAASAPDRVTHAVLANTSPRVADPGAMETRRLKVLQGGMAAVEEAVMQRFFSPELVASNAPHVPAHVSTTRRTLLATRPEGYAGCCGAIRDMDNTALLPRISVPVLVIGGDRDISTPWDGHGSVLAASIAGAKTAQLAPAAHLSNLERPRSFSAALLDFLLRPAGADTMDAGFAARRAVLGDDYVDRAMAGATSLNRNFQELITRYAWGAIWTRPGLDQRTRRLLAIAITAALGRWEEFRLHVRTGLKKELEACDLEEVLLQAAIYAGVPAANTAFQAAAEEMQSSIP